ncbi:Nuclear Hormone Receptor family [Caenorhabditis elegans]|uniref:Nuclear Hormone Receptor family n=1 Tax=Caenorhabditis elegans TaxID=6239 RepID=Q21700_CAEEL|nr:Nuclear Hormone Receptor family [Caenorhabditis elegans]CAA94839.1 Nuclear Hormone Receptor family [Caenorhabditis elegans]|eukprot:NP_505588.1 Nuclear Hormone Receptor family [Caenorhabditis elegans]
MDSLNFQFFEQGLSQKETKKPNCAICGDVGDGHHFGLDACRACAAFFRRTVALGKKFECRQQGACKINTIIRSICKSCRLNKCLNLGMKRSCVQPRRDKPQKEEKLILPSMNVSPADIEVSCIEVPIAVEAMPILQKMLANYEKLKNSRNIIHRREGDNIFEKRTPRSLKFRETLEILSNEMSLVADWIGWCFNEFEFLPTDQKSILFSNFSVNFIVLERAFLTSKHNNLNQWVLQSGDYIQIDNLEEFFTDEQLKIDGTKLAKLFKPSLEQNDNFHKLLKSEKIEMYDFLVFVVLLFWDHGIVGQTEECREISKKMKSNVTNEYIYYLKYIQKNENPVCQLTMLVSILTCLQRIVCRLREDMSLAHVFDGYTLPPNLYNIIIGRYI